ncbi:MAG: CRTAC1 family protein [Phycisphaerae bacterium]
MSDKNTAPLSADLDLDLEEINDDAVIGTAFRWSLAILALLIVFAAGTWMLVRKPAASRPHTAVEVAPPVVSAPAKNIPEIPFQDITTQSGIDYVHANGAYGEKLLPETMGGGNAFFDYDKDGDADLLFVDGAPWPWHRNKSEAHNSLRLYQNDGTGKFKNVTENSGLTGDFYGMGCAVGDYDNDGNPDVFVTAVGQNRLFANRGDGHFEDVSEAAGIGGSEDQWSTGAAFFDADNDGDLDLFVCNYIVWSRQIDMDINYEFAGIGRAYGPPGKYRGGFSAFYRNNGDGTFRDDSETAGVRIVNPSTNVALGKALAVSPIDADRDGDMDLIVANDTVQNFYFENDGNGRFSEKGAAYGIGFDRGGNATGAMGIDAAYFRNDNAIAVAIGNFANEMTSFYVSSGDPSQFADDAAIEGIGAPSRRRLTFGAFFIDVDLDGRLDFLQANGHLENDINKVQSSQQFEQPAQLFWNAGSTERGCYVEMPTESTGDLAIPLVGRGASYADIDLDGDHDVLITQPGRRPYLLRNDQASGNHYIRLTLRGTQANRDAIGAWIVAKVGDQIMQRQVMPTRSYLSQVELPVTIGIGKAASADVKIIWPSGKEHAVGTVAAQSAQTIVEPAD